MVSFLKKIKKYSIGSIITSFVLGFLLIIFPDVCIRYTGLFIGISLITLGLSAIISYFIKHKSILLVYLGALTIVFGIIVCVKYKEIVELIILLCGIALLASGITNLITSVRSIFSFKIVGGVSILMSIATIVFGAIAVINYANLTNTIIVLIGIALLVFAATELVTYIEVMRLAKDAKQSVDDFESSVVIDSASNNDIDVDATIEEE